ncbi:MAG: site-2 protease family protein [Fimbriimonas sp.]|nr:site-2 protease family protein [Fimbriimonas sp.]
MGTVPLPMMLATALILFLGIGLHEYAHCKFADMAGDPTPAFYGRVTLDLTKHFEITGVLMMILTTMSGFGLGWGKPSPVNPDKMRNPRVDWFVSVAAGPVSNLVQATIYAFILRIAMRTQLLAGLSEPSVHLFIAYLLFGGVIINLGLACFNLIPFGPLDGHWLVGLLLPEKPRYYWFRFNRQIGMPGLFVAVIALQALHVNMTHGPVAWMFHLLVGSSIEDTQLNL